MLHRVRRSRTRDGWAHPPVHGVVAGLLASLRASSRARVCRPSLWSPSSPHGRRLRSPAPWTSVTSSDSVGVRAPPEPIPRSRAESRGHLRNTGHGRSDSQQGSLRVAHSSRISRRNHGRECGRRDTARAYRASTSVGRVRMVGVVRASRNRTKLGACVRITEPPNKEASIRSPNGEPLRLKRLGCRDGPQASWHGCSGAAASVRRHDRPTQAAALGSRGGLQFSAAAVRK